jgi:hypothetical protein
VPPPRTTKTPRRLIHRDLREAAVKDGTYDRLLEAQQGVCAICGKPPPENRRLDIDHDHRTLLIRGLLCRGCNMRLRRDHTAPWLRQAADYLDGSWSAPGTESEAPSIPAQAGDDLGGHL